MPILLECFDEVILAFRKNACEDREVRWLDAFGKFPGGQTAPFNPTS
jgi:hypothetical protein